jgi:hypothetical protein
MVPLLFRLWPIDRMAQATFAEAFGQALAAGLAIDRALLLAARVNPSRRLRCFLRAMREHRIVGDSLAESLGMTRAPVDPRLIAALRAGEEHGGLAREVFAFARRAPGFSAESFRKAVGRSPEANQWAYVLARLLRDHGLTWPVIVAAGRGTDGGGGPFEGVTRSIGERLLDGETLADALRAHPGHFDELFCAVVENAASAEELRASLERLGSPRCPATGASRTATAPGEHRGGRP